MLTISRPEPRRVNQPLDGHGDAELIDITVQAAYDRAQAALDEGEPSTTIAISERLLESYPIDLRAHVLFGRGQLESGDPDLAIQAFAYVIDRDPENSSLLAHLSQLYHEQSRDDLALEAVTRAFELDPQSEVIRDLYSELRRGMAYPDADLPLAPATAVARWQIDRQDPLSAVEVTTHELELRPRDIALQLIRAEALWRANRLGEAERACRHLVTRLPRMIKPRLLLGLILCADPERATDGVELLHHTRTEDLSDDLISTLTSHSDFDIPPLADKLTITLPAVRGSNLNNPQQVTSLPRDILSRTTDQTKVAQTAFGTAIDDATNLLDEERGETDYGDEQSEVATSLANTPGLAGEALVGQHLLAFTLLEPLARQFGNDAVDRLDRRVRAVRRELATFDTSFDLVYLDDATLMAELTCEPVRTGEANDIRRAIGEVVRAYASRLDRRPTDRTGILLIGGDEVIPFFRLPNPSDDDDSHISTDNPYGSIDGPSVLTPNMPVGRLTTVTTDNLSVLLRQLDLLVDARRRPRLAGRARGIAGLGRAAFQSLGLAGATTGPLGLATSDLQMVIGDVLNVLPDRATIRSTPTRPNLNFDLASLEGRRCVHISLNGRPDNSSWLGRPVVEPDLDGWLAPIALTSDRLTGLNLSAPIVFAACGYSAAVGSGSVSPSFASGFLLQGAAGFVGASGSCYGTDLPPLTGCDLLANRFWSNLSRGLPPGEALSRARRQYVASVIADRGFLDGDDQKTLLQFTLYGDPLLPVFEEQPDIGDDVEATFDLHLICNSSGGSRQQGSTAVPLRSAIELVGSRWPEIASGRLRVQQRLECTGCSNPAHHSVETGRLADLAVTSVTGRAEIPVLDGPPLFKIVRITLASDGSLARAVVSR